MIKIRLHLLAVHVEDVQIHHSKTAAPSFVAFCKIWSLLIKDPIDESKVVFDLLVAFDVEASMSLDNGSLEVRHFRVRGRMLSSIERQGSGLSEVWRAMNLLLQGRQAKMLAATEKCQIVMTTYRSASVTNENESCLMVWIF